jgi:hypothetical protein
VRYADIRTDIKSIQNTHLHIDFISAQNDRDVLANAFEVTMPVRDVLVGDTGRDIEHDDTTLPLNVVSISQATKLLLTRGIPNIETDGSEVRVELQWVDFDTKGG